MNIVIVGRFSPPVLACIRSWGRKGHFVGFVNFDDGYGLKPRSKYLTRDTTIPLQLMCRDECVSKLNTFLEAFDADVLSCVDDRMACWLDDNKSKLNQTVFLASPSSRMVNRILSKSFQNQAAVRVGFDVLPEYIIHEKNKETITIAARHFPLCLRPSEPHHIQPFFKVQLIHSPKALKRFLCTIQIDKTGQIIAQPFKNMPNLVVHGIRTIAGDTRHLSCFSVERKFEGVTLTLKPHTDIDKSLLEKCARFVKSTDLIGNFHFEFLLDPQTQTAFFLEINHRFGGTTAKVLACGYDEPLYALEAHGIVKSGRAPVIRDKTVSNKQALLKYMATALTGHLSPLDFPVEPTVKKIMAGIKGLILYGDEVIALDDLAGSITLYLNNLFQIAGNRFHRSR